jgi:hypothetical protein
MQTVVNQPYIFNEIIFIKQVQKKKYRMFLHTVKETPSSWRLQQPGAFDSVYIFIYDYIF